MQRVVVAFVASLAASAHAQATGSAAPDDPVARGAKLFVQKTCSLCHSTDGTKLTAPTLKGLWGTKVPLADGTHVVADEAYVRESILNPGAKSVAGYLPVMPPFKVMLLPDEVDALVAYVRSIGPRSP